MKNEENIKEIIKSIHLSEGDGFDYDEAAIFDEYENQTANESSLAIKILSIFGGILAMLAFLGFLFIAGLYDSEIGLLLFGIAFIITAIWLNKEYDKLIIDTFSISTYIIGFALITFGLMALNVDENIVTVIILLIAVSSLIITQNYILSFISVLIISGSLLTLIISNDLYNFIHLYNILITSILTYCMLNESKIITSSKKLSKLYDPVKIGLIISLLFGLVLLGKRDLIFMSTNFIWISSILIFFIVIYLVSKILSILDVKDIKSKIIIYSLSVLVLISTIFSPSILGAILIVLLSFLVNYKTGLGIGIIALIYFVSQYYYDLNFTLLTKSIILFSSGIVFVAFYLFTNKKLKLNEKV